MANITEELNNPQWSEGIYQLETTDPVLGGPNGIANRQAKELAARTQYLKKKQEEDKPGAASTTKAGIVQLSSATDSNSEELAATPKSVKAAYDKAVESAGKGLPVGAVIGFPRAVTSQEGFLKADGSTFTQATYPDLYRVLGSNKLPNLTRSDIGMTAYFPFGDIPDGWIKYDEIATRVTQSAYPELYRKLVAQYGSIANVKPVDDYFVRNVGGSGQIGQQYPWTVGDHHHVFGLVAYGNDDLLLKRLPVDKYYPGQIKAGDPMFVIYGQLGGNEGKNNGTDMFSAAHEQAAIGKYSQKHAVPITYDHAYTDQYTPKPYYQDNTPKYIGMVLCIKAKDSLDDIVFWIKAYGQVTNAGALDASTLAAQLQDKADRNHTHRAADISDLGEAIKQQMAAAMQHQAGTNGYTKLPNDLIDQWGEVLTGWQGEGPVKVVFPIAFTSECYNVQITVKSSGRSGAVGTDLTIGAGEITATGFSAMLNTWAQGAAANDFEGFAWRAIGK
ncbi:phage tail protein [Eikenella glucosivorans]|uniref:phage tail protein n=1 Tax=Eikenella glucosivorans TaxID=2766967 RepID=UPI001EE5F93A|nr:phage tail protein [Eikenella glucosivorans]